MRSSCAAQHRSMGISRGDQGWTAMKSGQPEPVEVPPVAADSDSLRKRRQRRNTRPAGAHRQRQAAQRQSWLRPDEDAPLAASSPRAEASLCAVPGLGEQPKPGGAWVGHRRAAMTAQDTTGIELRPVLMRHVFVAVQRLPGGDVAWQGNGTALLASEEKRHAPSENFSRTSVPVRVC